jgi:hypothetical protein
MLKKRKKCIYNKKKYIMHWLLGLLGQVGSGLLSFASGAITLISNITLFGLRTAMQYHEKSIAFARSVGMSFKEATAYTSVLAKRAIDLGQRYGIAAEAVMKLEESLDNATNRQLMLSDVEAERMVRINKLVGEQVTSKFFEEMMVGMGAQIKATEGAVSKAYAEAAKRGLNASKMAEKVAQNLGMANRFSFRNGVDGLTKMVMQAEKLGASMSSVESAMGQFLELDSAIETAAHMQMLGGSAAAMFGNPLTAAFEANYDPEAFQKRLTDSLASYATFDEKTGMSHIGGMNMSFIRAIADALHISVDDVSKMAKKQAEVRYKENKFSPQLRGISDQERDFILNRSQIEGNRLKIGGQDVDELRRSGKLKEMMELSNMSAEEIEEKQALELVSINDKLEGIWTSLGGQLSEVFNKRMPKILGAINEIGETMNEAMPKITRALGEMMDELLSDEGIKNIKNLVKALADSGATLISKTIEFFTEAIKFFKDTTDFFSGFWDKLQAGLTAFGLYKGGKYINKAMPRNTPSTTANGGANPMNGTTKPTTPAAGTSGKGGGGKPSGGANGGANASGGAKPSGGANPNGGNLNKPSKTIEYNGHEYKQDAKGNWQVKQKNGSWRGVDRNLRPTLNALKGQQQTAAAAAAQANPTTTNTTPPQGAEAAAGTQAAKNMSKGARALKGLKAGGVGAGVVEGIVDAILTYVNYENLADYEKEIASNNELSREEKKRLIQLARKKADEGTGNIWTKGLAAVGGGATAAAVIAYLVSNPAGWLTTLALIAGSLGGGWLADKFGITDVGGKASEWLGGLLRGGEMSDEELDELINQSNGASPKQSVEKHANGGIVGDRKNVTYQSIFGNVEGHDRGGIVGGTSYSGDKVLTGLNSREMVLNLGQQANLFGIIDNLPTLIKAALSNANEVKSTPVVGEKPEYVYRPSKTEISSVNGNTITVKDFNVHMDGTIKLDAGTASRTLNMSEVLRSIDNDPTFKRALADLLYESIKERSNREMNNGRFLNDSPTKA